ncbi:MAG: hypothetical protein LBP40_05150 [Campylobacteraceae bacterium]|jgi:predicted neutral ceramidase superfamily lipid hydrolase|nr:hypothetical protein [Campylobacteraceae bacterium]
MEEQKHSKLGMISLAFGIMGVICLVAFFAIANTQREYFVIGDGDIKEMSFLCFFPCLVFSIIGTILSAAGFMSENRKKVFAALGLVFSGNMLFISICTLLVMTYMIE